MPPSAQVSSDLSSFGSDISDAVTPLAMLDRKLIAHAGAAALRVKIQWSGMPPSLATWEDEADLRRRFPSSPAWGHAGGKGGGDVRTPYPNGSKE